MHTSGRGTMTYLKNLILPLAGLLLLDSVLGGTPEYREECAVWLNVTNTLMYERSLPMNCDINQQCTGIDCTARFSYNGAFSMYQDFTEDFCFGLAIHPCDRPLTTNFYVEKPDDESEMYQRKVSNGTKFQLPGTHYSMGGLGSADGFVIIDMNEQNVGGHRYVKLGVKYKTRVTSFGIGTWPPDLSFVLMPDTFVPVPPCRKAVVTPTHNPNNCATFTPHTGTPATGIFIPTTPPTHFSGNGTKCKLDNTFGSCGLHQICRADSSGSQQGTCYCMRGFVVDGNGCKEVKPVIHGPDYISEPDYSKDSKSKSKLKILIPVGVGVVLLIVGAAAAFVVVKYRRYKARYGQHTVLLGDEDEDDDRDHDEPMVEG